MTTADAVLAVGTFVVFGAVGLAMAASARGTWREGRADDDRLTLFAAIEQFWPAVLALAVALGAPIAILFNA
jgi:hypothetical protein